MNDEDDRFGMSDSAIRGEAEQHRGIDRHGMYVPTRREVRTMDAGEIAPILIDWIFECPSFLIPNNQQIQDVIEILKARPDAGAFSELIAELERDSRGE